MDDNERKPSEAKRCILFLAKTAAIYFILAVFSKKAFIFAGAISAIPPYLPAFFSNLNSNQKLLFGIIFGFAGMVSGSLFLIFLSSFELNHTLISAFTGFAFLIVTVLTEKHLLPIKQYRLKILFLCLLNISIFFSIA